MSWGVNMKRIIYNTIRILTIGLSILVFSISSFTIYDYNLSLKLSAENNQKPFISIPNGLSININSISIFVYPKKHSKYVQTNTFNSGIRYRVSSNIELYYCVFQKGYTFKNIRIDEGFSLSNHIGISFKIK